MATLACLALFVWGAALSAAQSFEVLPTIPPEFSTHAFYYIWYQNPESDGNWSHWNHQVLPHWTEGVNKQYKEIGSRFTPPDAVHSPFFPSLGPYSSSDPGVVRRHFEDMLAAGVRVAAASWWGPQWREGTTDGQGVTTDTLMPMILRVAEEAGMKIAIHLEPYVGRTAGSTHEDLRHLMRQHGASSALLRLAGRPLYYVYDSYHTAAEEWAQLLTAGGNMSVRGTELDGIFIGLWLNQGDGDSQLLPGGFDGFYSYFSSEAVSYASNPHNWPTLSSWAQQHGKLFIPSVGPGYDDRKIRPWNGDATRGREGGQRYRRWWEAALAAVPAAVSITSFNEWGEGTQIEAAQVFSSSSSSDPDAGTGADGSSGRQPPYQSYGSIPGRDEFLYLNITLQYTQQFAQAVQDQQQYRDARPHGEL